MSLPGGNLVEADDGLISAGINSTGSVSSTIKIIKTTTERIAVWLNDRVSNFTGNESALQNSDSETTGDRVTNFLLDSTTKLAQNLQEFTTTSINNSNISEPEVTIRRPEVDISDSGIGTAEKVVIGAAGIVACMAIVAIFLRFLGPHCRSKKSDPEEDEEKAITDDTVISKLSGFANLGSDITSQSSGLGNSSTSQDCSQSTGSTPVTDWSDISGDRTKSSSGSGSSSGESDVNMAGKNTHFAKIPKNGPMPTRFQPGMYSSEDRLSAKSSPGVRRKVPDERVSIISTQSLEPLSLGQNYRDNWDDQFDPSGSIPRGNLSHLSHPSESRLSLNSISSGSSNTTFPIPSRDVVRQMHKDKERRYPSNTTLAKKEKHNRSSPPDSRKSDNK